MQYLSKIFWKIWNFWFRISDKIRFLLVGGFNACVQYALYACFLYFCGEEIYQTALVLSWIISSFSSFATQKIFVFCTKGKFVDWLKEYIKCLGVWLVSYSINAIILGVLVKFAAINAYIAQIIAVACTTVSSYILFKYFAFKHKKNDRH